MNGSEGLKVALPFLLNVAFICISSVLGDYLFCKEERRLQALANDQYVRRGFGIPEDYSPATVRSKIVLLGELAQSWTGLIGPIVSLVLLDAVGKWATSALLLVGAGLTTVLFAKYLGLDPDETRAYAEKTYGARLPKKMRLTLISWRLAQLNVFSAVVGGLIGAKWHP